VPSTEVGTWSSNASDPAFLIVKSRRPVPTGPPTKAPIDAGKAAPALRHPRSSGAAVRPGPPSGAPCATGTQHSANAETREHHKIADHFRPIRTAVARYVVSHGTANTNPPA
jgi:hypothetical protein